MIERIRSKEVTSAAGESRDQPSPKTWRHLLRFSLRGLMIVVLVVGGGLGWIVHRAQVQHDSVAEIRGAGGIVLYEWQFKNGQPAGNGTPRASSWLEKRIGVDYFQNVTYVSLPSSGADRELVAIGHLGRLETLMLGGASVSDEGLSHLKGLTDLQSLILFGTKVSSTGLKHLTGLSRLKSLSLARTNVTDAGMVHLQSLTSLEDLDLSMTKISDAGLVNLQRLRNVSRLRLQMTGITDAGLVHLRGLANLQWLGLRGAKIVRNASLGALRDAIPKVHIDY
jgi:Leucine Rich repeat